MAKEINKFGRRIRPVAGYEGRYGVTDRGEVMSMNGEYLLKPYRGQYVMLSGKCFRLDYLVARAFVPNVRMCSELRHKDGDVLNCRADNLEWVDERPRTRVNFGKPKVAVNCLDDDYKVIRTYPSVSSAAKALGISQPGISNAMRTGKRCGGYRWSMALEGDEEKK